MSDDEAEKLNQMMPNATVIEKDAAGKKIAIRNPCHQVCSWVKLIDIQYYTIDQIWHFPVYYVTGGVQIHQYYLSCRCP